MKSIKQVITISTTIAALTIQSQSAFAANEPVTVNVDNFVRAETAAQFDRFFPPQVALINLPTIVYQHH